MRPPESASRAGCPELELLATFIEGRLEPGERERLIEHLADCDSCREVVSESRALLGDLALEEREPIADVRHIRARSARNSWRIVAAAGLLLALGGVGAWLLASSRTVDSAVAAFIDEGGPVRLASGWSDPRWPVMRGAESGPSDRAIAFRLGARTVDLEMAVVSENPELIRELALEGAALLEGLPFTSSIADRFRALARKPEGEPIDSERTRRLLKDLKRELPPAVGAELFALGRWAECGRLLASTRSAVALPPAPRLRLPESDLGGLTEAADRVRHESDAATRESAFERLVARGGSIS